MTSKQLKKNLIRKKNVPKAGFVQETIEINEHYLEEILQNNNS